MKITIEIDDDATDNAAFDGLNEYEVAEKLSNIVRDMIDRYAWSKFTGRVHEISLTDENGNTIGKIEYTSRDNANHQP